jgi:hypothetical protein
VEGRAVPLGFAHRSRGYETPGGAMSAEMSMHAIAFGSAISFIAAVITKLL